MIDPRFAQLARYLRDTDHTTSHADFWAGWDAIAGDLADRAWDDNADICHTDETPAQRRAA